MPDSLVNIIIEELKSELKSKYPDFRGIYLFGSRARGDYNDDSDYDFLLMFNREIDTVLPFIENVKKDGVLYGLE